MQTDTIKKVLHRFLTIVGFDSCRLMGIFAADEQEQKESGGLNGKAKKVSTDTLLSGNKFYLNQRIRFRSLRLLKKTIKAYNSTSY